MEETKNGAHDNTTYIYGTNPVKEALKTVKEGTLFLRKGLQDKRITDLVKKCNAKNVEVVYVDKEYMKKFFPGKAVQGIVLKIDAGFTPVMGEKELVASLTASQAETISVVVLDGIKDVGNFGALLRSCYLFDVDYVILPRDNSAPVNEVVYKRSAGAASFIHICYVTNITRILEKLKTAGFWVYGTAIEGEVLSGVRFDKRSVFVLGEEGRGIRPLVAKQCDFQVTINTNNKLDSLNLSVSAGIILYENFIQKMG